MNVGGTKYVNYLICNIIVSKGPSRYFNLYYKYYFKLFQIDVLLFHYDLDFEWLICVQM